MAVHSSLKEKMTVSKMQGFEVPEYSAVQASQSLIPNLAAKPDGQILVLGNTAFW